MNNVAAPEESCENACETAETAPAPRPLAAIVLAAGQGTRMKSDLPKVAHLCAGRSLVRWAVDAVVAAGATRVVTVIGHGADLVRELVPETSFALQAERKGTGHAVSCALPSLADYHGPVLVTNGDSPLITAATLTRLADAQRETGAAMVALTFETTDQGYGRIVRDPETGYVLRIVEQKDCTPEEAAITECNAGFYCFDKDALEAALARVTPNNAQGEYYLTDVLAICRAEGKVVLACKADNFDECRGVNTPEQLAVAEGLLLERLA